MFTIVVIITHPIFFKSEILNISQQCTRCTQCWTVKNDLFSLIRIYSEVKQSFLTTKALKHAYIYTRTIPFNSNEIGSIVGSEN